MNKGNGKPKNENPKEKGKAGNKTIWTEQVLFVYLVFIGRKSSYGYNIL